jgi:hypothetical protein
MPAWSADAALRLMGNEDFIALFEDPSSPLFQEMERLAKLALDPVIAIDQNRGRLVRIVSERAGMDKVRKFVTQAVETPPVEVERKRASVRRSTWMDHFPRLVG